MYSIITGEIPKPPNLPKPSSFKQKNLAFLPFKSSSPDLLAEIKRLIEGGLREIRLEEREDVFDARLAVFQKAFQRFIEDFGIYRPFLESVKLEYDNVIDELWQRLRSVPTNELEYAMKEERNEIAMKDMKIQHTIQIKDMVDQRKAIITANLMKEKDIKNAELVAKSVNIENEKLQQELEDAKKSITMLTKALNGLEEEKKLHDEREVVHSTENVSLHLSIQKALEDIESLRHEKDDLIALQATLVSNESLERNLQTIEVGKIEARRLELSHRQLVHRYSHLKVAIDTAFKQYVPIPVSVNETTIISSNSNLAIIPPPEKDVKPKSVTKKNTSNSAAKKKTPSSVQGTTATSITIKPKSPGKLEGVPTLTELRAQIQQKILLEQEKNVSAMSIEIPKDPDVILLNDKDPITTLGVFSMKGGDPKAIIEKLMDEIELSKQQLHLGVLKYSSEAMLMSIACLKGGIDTIYHDKETTDAGANSKALAVDDDGAQSLILIPGAPTSIQSQTEKKLQSPWGPFDGLGMEDSVPNYLKSSNIVQNLFISYSDTVSFVREITLAKMGLIVDPATERPPSNFKHDNHIEHDKTPFAEYFELFLKERFRAPQRVIEMSYNLLAALKKYSFDSDCRIFLAVLNGAVSEDIWDDQRLILTDILREMGLEDRLKGPMTTNSAASIASAKAEKRKILTSNFMKALQRALPTKPDISFKRLSKALTLEVKANRGIDYEALLGVSELQLSSEVDVEKNAKGNQLNTKASLEADSPSKKRSMFMDLLHLQHLSECIEYVDHLIMCIDNAYTTHAAALALTQSQMRSEVASSSSRQSSRAVIATNFDNEVKHSVTVSEVLNPLEPGVIDAPSLPLGIVRQAVLTSDSNKTRGEVNRLLSYCCKLTIEEMLLMEARRAPFPVEEIKKRIRMKIMKKSTPISN